MTDYIELNISAKADLFDILTAELAELGFESFTEDDISLQAYIPFADFKEAEVSDLLNGYAADNSLTFTIRKVDGENWNSVWEENFQPIVVKDMVLVYADFHQPDKQYPYMLKINPKMSFGTGHHSTTKLILEYLLELDIAYKSVIDAGCGTGILAIMAAKKNASDILAYDYDAICVENTIENFELNNVQGLIWQGESDSLTDKPAVDILIANITRNILLGDMPMYANKMKSDAVLLLSGFYQEDLPLIIASAEEQGLSYVGYKTELNWVAAMFEKRLID